MSALLLENVEFDGGGGTGGAGNVDIARLVAEGIHCQMQEGFDMLLS